MHRRNNGGKGMKAVIVIDMPDGVSLDEWYAVKVVVDRLKATEEELIYGIPYVESKLFRFVPLRPLPEKKGKHRELHEYDTDIHYEIGWNDCLDEITGETE